MASSAGLILIALAVGTYVCLDGLARFRRDAREPPDARSLVPYLSHVVGILGRGMSYFKTVGEKQSTSMYTLRVPFLNIYVANGIDLVSALQRAAKTLSFTPFQKITAVRLSHVSKSVLDLFDANCEFPGTGQYVKDIDAATHNGLLPGPAVDSMNLHTCEEFIRLLDGVRGEGADVTDLYAWVREVVSVASTRGVYGPRSPYLDHAVIDAFWDLDTGIGTLLAGYPVSLLAPRSNQATKTLTQAFQSYFSQSGEEEASEVVQGRCRVHKSYGLSLNDMARMEWPLTIAVLSNTVPTCFWTIYEIYRRPDLLAELRKEVASTIVTSEDDDPARKLHTLDITKLKTSCKLLLSTFQETQRTRSQHATIRKVLQDTTIEKKYLLKKDNYVQFPSAQLHYSPSLWGSDAAQFTADRFSHAKVAPNAFAPWGNAPHLCPARQFATTEVLALVAMLVLRFELVPVGGEWVGLEVNRTKFSTMLPPTGRVEVGFRRREEWEGVWKVAVGRSVARFPIVSI